MPNEIDETQVLNTVLSAFAPLSPDAKKRLLQTIATFFDLGNVPGQERHHPDSMTGKTSQTTFSRDRTESPKDFLHEKNPESETERLVCLSYYLTHYRGVHHFKTLDLTELNTEAAQVKFSNSTAVVHAALRQGLLGPAPSGNKQITARGERFVSLLPDREAARSAIANARPQRKPKRKS